MIDAQVGRLGRCLGCGKEAEAIVQLGATVCDLLRLWWLARPGSRSQQIELGFGGIQPCRQAVRQVLGLAAGTLQLIAISIEFRIAQVRAAKVALQTVKVLPPGGDLGIKIKPQFLVQILGDRSSIDRRIGRRRGVLTGSITSLCRYRSGWRNRSCGLSEGARSGPEYRSDDPRNQKADKGRPQGRAAVDSHVFPRTP